MVAIESTLTQTGTYVIDPLHSRIEFAARHAMLTRIRGSFSDFEGGGYFDIERPESSAASVTIASASVDTRHPDRDEQLRSADLLDAASHPSILFSAVSVDQVGTSAYRVAGDLTIKGMTKPAVFQVERTGWRVEGDGSQRIGFEGRGVINPRDWGLDWNKLLASGDAPVRDQVTVEFEISAVKAAPVTAEWY